MGETTIAGFAIAPGQAEAAREAAPSRQGGQVRGLAQEASDLIALTPGLVAFNFLYMLSAWLIALGAIAVAFTSPVWYILVLAFLVVSSRQQALLNCEHECVHRKFVRGKRANELVGTWLCASPVGSPFGAAQARHLAHHRLLALPGDPDHVLHSGEPPKNTRWGLVSYFARGLLGAYAVMILLGPKEDSAAPSEGSALRDLAALVVTQLAIFAGLTLAFDWWVYPALWLAPLVTVTALSHLIRNFAEHAVTEPEMATNGNRLITIRSNPLERGLIAPFNMNFHAEHHLLPSVPAPRLPELQKRLESNDALPPMLKRSSYGFAIRHYLSALRR